MPNYGTSKPLDEEFIRGILASAYSSHFQFAPREIKEALDICGKSVIRKDRRGATEAALLSEMSTRKSLSELCGALQDVSPKASTHLLAGEHHDCLRDYKSLKSFKTFSLARGTWLIGVFGKGTDDSQYGALQAFNKYVRWVSAYLANLHIAAFAETDDTERLAVHPTRQLEINRLVEPETRMMWITDEISAAIGIWVDRNLPSISHLIGSEPVLVATENAHKAVNSLKSSFRDNKSFMSEPFSAILLNGISEDLTRKLTARPTVLNEENVEEALLGETPTITPFVHIDDTTWVLNRSAWLMHRDDALFRFAMKESPSDRKGQIFEDVTASMLQKWGPRATTWNSSVDLLRPESRKHKDEVDVFGCSDGIAFIGECKANKLSANNSSVGSSFETVVLNNAVSQLETRMTHWSEGWRPNEANPCKASEAIGFAITFSSYGGLLWQSEGLLKEDVPAQYAVIPLHSLVLVASILDEPQDLKLYLEHRERLITGGAANSDELEYILGFISELKGCQATAPEGTRALFRQYQLDENGVWIDPRVHSGLRDWKQQFRDDLWDHTEPVTP